MAVNPQREAEIRQIWPDIENINNDEYRHWLSYLDLLSSAIFAWSRDRNPPRALFECATASLDVTLDMVSQLRDLTAQRWGPHPRIDDVEDMTRAEIVEKIKTQNLLGLGGQAENSILNALCLAISLWTTVEIGVYEESGLSGTKKVNSWAPNMTLAQLLSNTFPKTPPPSSLNVQSMILHPKLTMEYLCTFHSFDWLFTHDLSEHLDIRWAGSQNNRKPILMIYRHKVFLRNEIAENLRGTRRSKLPIDVVEEALDTLNLLFPYNDHRTRRLLRAKNQEAVFYDLAWCGRGRSLDLRRYVYWGERIAQLSEISKGELLGFSQLLPDRDGRNLMQTVNFWTAAGVAVFTIFSLVFGGLSIAFAKWSYDVSQIAYELALAQACAAADAETQLPRFCHGNVSVTG